MSKHAKLPTRSVLLAYIKINQSARKGRPLSIFKWRERPREYFSSDRDWKRWNTQFAGKPAGTLVDGGYLYIGINGVRYAGHRILYYLDTGVDPGNKEVDHRDGVISNNRPKNLRLASRAQNNRNRGVQRNNVSGVAGVRWYSPSSKWHAQIKVNSKRFHLGYFTDFDDAVAARKTAEELYFGAFARRPTLAQMIASGKVR
jgi:hypothetical protein